MILHMVIFFTVFLGIYIGMHYYVLARVVAGLGLAGQSVLVLKLLFLVGAVSFLGAEILSHRFQAAVAKPVHLYGAAWMGILSIAVTVFLMADLARLFNRAPAFRHTATVAALTVIGIVALWALLNVAAGPRIREVSIPARLPGAARPVTIVQLSDVHLTLLTSAGWLEKVVARVNALAPDMILITGDLLDGDLTRRPDLCALLRQLKAPRGVFAVSGNHEYYVGMGTFRSVAEESGIVVIDNQTVETGLGLRLIGISDHPATPPYLSTVQPSSGTFSLLMSHQPDVFDQAVAHGVNLQLSGHTHAGQVPPMDAIVQFYFKYAQGLYRKEGSYLYVTPGTGWWGPPMRVFSRCEIVKVVLGKG